MRSVKATILLGLATFLIVLAPLLRFWAEPRLEKAPLDQYFTDIATGTGTYLDVGSLSIKGPEKLTVTRVTRGDVEAGSDNTAVWDVFTRLNNSSGTLVDAFTERWVFDRHTALPVHCCGENPRFDGVYLKFGFDASKSKTYPYWDPTAKKSFPARYIGTVKVQGHSLYEYQSVIPPTKITEVEIPGSLVGSSAPSLKLEEFYSNDNSTALVDPHTGVIAAGSSHQKRTLRLPGSSNDLITVLDVNLTLTDETVTKLLKEADDGNKKLDLIGLWIPLISLVLGVGLLALSIVLMRRADRAQPPAAPRHAEQVPAGFPPQREMVDLTEHESKDRPTA